MNVEQTGEASMPPSNSSTPASPAGMLVQMSDEWAPEVSPVAVPARGRRFRWGVAGAIVLVVAVVTAGAAYVLSGATAPKSLTASIAPANSVVFLEIRTDLPGDQRSNLADFLYSFPGFKDRAQFDNGVDQALNMLTSMVSPDLLYTSAFKPWMEGEISIAIQDPTPGSTPGTASSSQTCGAPTASHLPDLVSGSGSLGSLGSVGSLMSGRSAEAIFALKDRAAAAGWLSGEVARLNLTSSSQSYAGQTLYLIGSGVGQGAYALTDQDLILGTVNGVKAALDTVGHGALASSAGYQAAMSSLTGDSLARFYVDVKSLASGGVAEYRAAACELGALALPTLPVTLDTSKLPVWVAGSVRAESGKLVVETNAPRAAGTQTRDNHTSRLAPNLPATTVAAFEAHSIGAALDSGLSAVESAAPAAGIDAGGLKTLQQALFLVGGVGWLGDATAVVTRDGSTYGGGFVVEAPDAATAKSKLGSITSLIKLSGVATGIDSKTETYKGSSITLITIPASVAGTTIQVGLAVKDNLIVAGYTDAFAKAVLDTTSKNSLASQPDYLAAVGAAGSSNESSAYVNVPALEDQIGLAAFAGDPNTWTLYYKPYFDHVGGIAYAVVDGSMVTTRLVVTAR